MNSPRGPLVLGFLLLAGAGSQPHLALAQQPRSSPAAAAPQPTPAVAQPAKPQPESLKPAPAPQPEAAKSSTSTQSAAPKAPAAAPVDPPSVAAPVTPGASSMPREPSIYETGRVGRMGVSDSGVKIKQTPDASKPKETRVEGQPIAISDAPAIVPTQTKGALEQAVLGRELQARLGLLRGCRVEVARHKKVAPATVQASRVILRWVVMPSGQVTDTQVVATAPVDGQVVDCVKRQMSQWSFTPPRGGPAQVERTFKF